MIHEKMRFDNHELQYDMIFKAETALKASHRI